MESETIGERLGRLPGIIAQHLDVPRLSAKAFAESVGSASQNLNGYVKHGKMPPASIVAEVAQRYPFVSLRWLLLGEGEPVDATPSDLLGTIYRLGAERGVTFDRLSVEPLPDGSTRFDAAGIMAAR